MSDATGPYDPNAIEGEKSTHGQYISAKDLKIWGVGLAVLGVMLYPIYKVMEGNSERHRCISNLNSIYKAINFYAEQHDNRFPPIARTEGDGVTPSLSENGNPYTWVSDVAPFMNARDTFTCPTAAPNERVQNESAASARQTVPSTYGMYSPYGGVLTSLVESPDQVVIVAETSDRGTRDTADPAPFAGNRSDGFVLGWSDTNTTPAKGTESVTRLAFPGFGKGKRDVARHGKFIQGLSASGELLQLVPDDAAFHAGGGVNPHWRLPPGYRPAGG